MANGEQSGSSDRADWRNRLTTAVGAAIGGGLAMLVLNLADVHMFPLGLFVFLAGLVIGIVLARLVGSLLFRRPPGG